VDVPSSVSISGSTSVSCWLSWAVALRVKNSAQGREVCEYAYAAGKYTIWERWAPEVLLVGADGVLGRGGIGSGVGCLRWLGGGARALRLQRVSGFCTVPFWQGRHPAVWFWWSIARCLSIAAFSFLCPGNSTRGFFSSQTSARRFFDQIVCFLYCGLHKLSSCHFGHIQGQADVRLFQLYLTSLLCHSSRHVENLPEISCCFEQWDSAITSTIYACIASSQVIKACFIHSWGCLSGNLSVKIPALRTLRCLILLTVRTNSLVEHGGFPLQAAIYRTSSSLLTPSVCYAVIWRPFTTIWIYLHPNARCFLFVLLPVLQTNFKCASWGIFLVTAVAATGWTNWCLHSCCALMSDPFDHAPANRLDFDPLSPGWGGCVFRICWCGIGEEDDDEKKWEVLRNI